MIIKEFFAHNPQNLDKIIEDYKVTNKLTIIDTEYRYDQYKFMEWAARIEFVDEE